MDKNSKMRDVVVRLLQECNRDETRFISLTKNKMLKNVNWHSVRTICFWAIVFIMGGLQAINGSKVGDFTTLISILGFLEHTLAGDTSTPTS